MELNINKVPIKDKKGNVKMYWRWNYLDQNNRPLAITKISKAKVKEKAQQKIKEIGFIKTSTHEVLLKEANISFQKWLKYKVREGTVNLHHTKNYGSFFKGSIDDVTLYSTALEAPQVLRNYKAGKRRHKN